MFSVPLNVSLGESKVKQENLVCSFVMADAEVIWLYIPVDEVSIVHVLNTSHHLVDQHENCLEGELSESLVEEGLKRRTHQIHDQNIVIACINRFVPSVEQ